MQGTSAWSGDAEWGACVDAALYVDRQGISRNRVMPDSYAKNDDKHGVADTDRATLTDAEREAIEWYASFPDGIHADTLRSLLERTK